MLGQGEHSLFNYLPIYPVRLGLEVRLSLYLSVLNSVLVVGLFVNLNHNYYSLYT